MESNNRGENHPEKTEKQKMIRCTRMHSKVQTQATGTLDRAPLCTRHLNREIKEATLRECKDSAPKCPEEGHRTQLPGYRPNIVPVLFCWGTKGSAGCSWRHTINVETLDRAEKKIREERAQKLPQELTPARRK